METRLVDNNNETNSSRLGGLFLIISWLIAIGLIAAIANGTIFASKAATIIHTSHGTQITLQSDYDSHFRVKGSINGIPTTFLVDTGSTSVAISESLAAKAGLPRETQIASETANGAGTGYLTKIDTLMIDGVEIRNVAAVIIPDMGHETALLGMNVLSKFTIQQTNSTMTLIAP